MRRLIAIMALSILAIGSAPEVAHATQAVPPTTPSQSPVEGVVVSATSVTLIVRTADGAYHLFELGADTTMPSAIPIGATVSVTANPQASLTAPVAATVRITAMPPAQPAPTPGTPAAAPPAEPVPPAVRRLEQSIQRQTRKYRIGVRAGAALDPELVMLGAQGVIGPFFSQNVWARPTFELGFGEVTDLIALNFEGIYRVPISRTDDEWSTFIGGGPGLIFSKLGFADDDDNFDFDDFDLGVGLNLIAGVQARSGLFLELKATAYAGPSIRFFVGYTF